MIFHNIINKNIMNLNKIFLTKIGCYFLLLLLSICYPIQKNKKLIFLSKKCPKKFFVEKYFIKFLNFSLLNVGKWGCPFFSQNFFQKQEIHKKKIGVNSKFQNTFQKGLFFAHSIKVRE